MNSFYIAVNLLKRVFADLKGWVANLILPVIILSLIVGFVGNEAAKPVKVGYANMDQGVLGGLLVTQLQQKSEYELIELTQQELTERIISGKIQLGAVIPQGFTAGLLQGRLEPVQHYYLNISDKSFSLELALQQTVRQLEQTVQSLREKGAGEEQLLAAAADIFELQAKQQVSMTITDSGMAVNENLFLVIGFILFFVMGSIFSSIGLVLEDRNQMTMARIYTAPIRSFEIALGNFMGSFVLGLLQIAAVLAITKYGLGYDYQIGFLTLLLILSFFLLAAVGIGSAIAGLVKNSSSIGQLNALVITPTCMIGGCWWPLSVMPDFMQKLANFVPQKWAIDAVERVAAGGGLQEIVLNMGILVLFAAIFLSFGAAVLRPSERAV